MIALVLNLFEPDCHQTFVSTHLHHLTSNHSNIIARKLETNPKMSKSTNIVLVLSMMPIVQLHPLRLICAFSFTKLQIMMFWIASWRCAKLPIYPRASLFAVISLEWPELKLRDAISSLEMLYFIFSERFAPSLGLWVSNWRLYYTMEYCIRKTYAHFPPVQKLCVDRGHSYVDDFLRKYGEALQDRPPWESPIACFERIKVKYIQPKLTTSIFRCRHVTFTPTRMLFEGPYATQSNRIIRQFSGYEDYFLRVDFRDEDRLQYRWSREVDGASFVRERVGTTLKQGFEIAGKHFEFLAYSSSALREHAVWFMSPFQHPKYGFVNSAKIRDQIGDFRGKELIKQPSKYGARLAQAFTATEASVTIKRSEWEQVEDIKPATYKEGDTSPNLFTDGLGSISRALGDKIWTELCAGRQDHGLKSIKPSAVSLLTWFHIPSPEFTNSAVSNSIPRIQGCCSY